MATSTKKSPTNAELKKLAERVNKLKAEGKRWPEIMRTVKEPDIIKGPASGRRLLRQFNLTDAIIEQDKSGNGKSKSKKAPAKKSPAKGKATKKATPKTKATAQKARRNQPRTKTDASNPVTVRHDPSIIKDGESK